MNNINNNSYILQQNFNFLLRIKKIPFDFYILKVICNINNFFHVSPMFQYLDHKQTRHNLSQTNKASYIKQKVFKEYIS